jgi:hypothetical protein
MSWVLRKGFLLGLGVSTAIASPVTAEAPTRLELAQKLAGIHAIWPQGRDWLAAHSAKAGELIAPVLNQCVPDAPDGELTAFSVYLRLTQTGKIREVVTDVDADLGRCMTKEASEISLPEAPRDDFWIQVNLAAML